MTDRILTAQESEGEGVRESSGKGQGCKGTEAQRQKEAKQFQETATGIACCKTELLRKPWKSNGQRQLMGAMTRLRIQMPFSVQHVSAVAEHYGGFS